MRRSILRSFITNAVCLLATASHAANSDSPEGTWATEIVGRDHGICYLTFSNDFSVAGYGISIDALGPFDVVGGWDFDRKGRIVGGIAEIIDGNSHGAKIRGKANNNKLRLHAGGGVNLKGDPAGSISDLTGAWVSEVRTGGKKFFVTYDATLSTNTPAWFDLTGQGVNDGRTFTVSGALLIAPSRRVAGYTIDDYGTSTKTASFVGKINSRGQKLRLRGRTDSNNPITIHGERP